MSVCLAVCDLRSWYLAWLAGLLAQGTCHPKTASVAPTSPAPPTADGQQFFRTFCAPNRAALAVVGDFEPAEAKAWMEKYFANIPACMR